MLQYLCESSLHYRSRTSPIERLQPTFYLLSKFCKQTVFIPAQSFGQGNQYLDLIQVLRLIVLATFSPWIWRHQNSSGLSRAGLEEQPRSTLHECAEVLMMLLNSNLPFKDTEECYGSQKEKGQGSWCGEGKDAGSTQTRNITHTFELYFSCHHLILYLNTLMKIRIPILAIRGLFSHSKFK